jgi:PKD repeat protein
VIATPAASTQYIVVGTDANGCSASTNVNVQLANPPTIGITATPSDTICNGGTIILSAAPGGGGPQNTYLWSDNITTRRDTVIVTSNMTLSVIVTNQAGCSSYDTISLYALPAQNSNFGYTQVGSTFSFVDSTAGSTNWYWDFGDGNNSTNQNPTYTYSQLGVYTVMFVVTGPCKTDTIYQTVAIYPEATNDINKNVQVTCFPNPTNEQLTIQSNLASIESIKIMNLMGEKVKEIKVTSAQSSIQVSVKDLPKGMYTIMLQSGKNLFSTKFVKQ